jgi:WD40 repeat protein
MCRGRVVVLEGHTDGVGRVRMSPDLSRLATGSYDGTARVWRRDSAGGFTVEAVLEGHKKGWWVPVGWSADSQRLVTGDDTGKLHVYDASDWSAPRTTIDVGRGAVRSVSVRASDGLVLAGCGDGGIRVVDVSTGRVERTLAGVHTKSVWSVNWSPAGTHFASGDMGGKAVIWSASTWRPVHELRGHRRPIWGSMRWSPDSSRVLTACGDKKVRIFSGSTGALERTMEGSGMEKQIDADWSPDGALVASVGDDKVVRVWDARSGALVRSLAGHTGWIWGVDWTRGDVIASCGSDSTVRMWNVSDLGVAASASSSSASAAAAATPARAAAPPAAASSASTSTPTASAAPAAPGAASSAAASSSADVRALQAALRAKEEELAAERQAKAAAERGKAEAERQLATERQAKADEARRRTEAERQLATERQAKSEAEQSLTTTLQELDLLRSQLAPTLSSPASLVLARPPAPHPSTHDPASFSHAITDYVAESSSAMTAASPAGSPGAASSGPAAGCNGAVVLVRYKRLPTEGTPRLALKIVFNLGAFSASAAARNAASEYEMLALLPLHQNIMRMYYAGPQELTDAFLDALPLTPDVRELCIRRNPFTGAITRATFMVLMLERLDKTLKARREAMPSGHLVSFPLLLRWSCDLMAGVAHMYRHRVLHLDMKPDNVMLAGDERLVIVDFGLAMHFPLPYAEPVRGYERRDGVPVCRAPQPDPVTAETWAALERPAPFALTWGALMTNGKQPYGNIAHVAPELQNAASIAGRSGRADVVLDYTKQAVFDTGIVICEMMAGVHPLGAYPTSVAPLPGSPDAARTPCVRPYGPEAILVPEHHEAYPDAFLALLRRMVAFRPEERPSVGEVLRALWDERLVLDGRGE